jgi:uncharacterized membrane-anchored protein
MNLKARRTTGIWTGSTALACLIGALALPAGAQESQGVRLDWQQGPMTAPIGDHLAEIEIGGDYLYLDAGETQRFLELNQNPVSGDELATIAPLSEDASWFLIFEFSEIGYVSDEEKDELDADAILASIREGTEASNEARRERGWPTMTILGWHEPPHYDENTNNLSWAIIGESQGHQSVNRLVKLLGRKGVMTATLVSPPDELSVAVSDANDLLSYYRYQPGSTYAEYLPGTDKLAKYGLTALVVGGAGAALVKSGLLARLWKPIALGLVALGAGIKRLFFGGSAQHDPEKPIV